MKIQFDCKIIETISQNLDKMIVTEFSEQLNKLKTELDKISANWVDEENNSHIIAINAKISQFEKMKADSQKYKAALDAAVKAYKKAIEDNMKLAKSL